jgi:hypothetical protein
MCKTFIALVAVTIEMICASPATAQAFNHTFGGSDDAKAIGLLAAFGSLDITCGNPMTDFQARVTLDASTSPPTVVLTEVGKGPFSKGPVTHIDWIKDMRPNEFGRPISFVALWIIKFLWGTNNAGNGQVTLALPTPSASAAEANLVLNGGGKVWGYECGPAMAVYKCAPGAPGCN